MTQPTRGFPVLQPEMRVPPLPSEQLVGRRSDITAWSSEDAGNEFHPCPRARLKPARPLQHAHTIVHVARALATERWVAASVPKGAKAVERGPLRDGRPLQGMQEGGVRGRHGARAARQEDVVVLWCCAVVVW
eukprot:1352189-Alexandrium_andersonii.AAC.1